tara:strand:+ start:140 stop:658 length:519 start_codon:yes stop_codon:yes gene_type:complete
MKQSRKEFIKKAHSAACSDWKENIEKEFPKLFKKDGLEVGKWYKSEVCLFNYQKYSKVYGFFTDGGWTNGGWIWDGTSAKLATDKEVEEALIKEAKKRGFKKGVSVDKVNLSADYNPNNKLKENTINTNELFSRGYLWVSSIIIYDNGEWATVVDTITKEQADKKLGKTILN